MSVCAAGYSLSPEHRLPVQLEQAVASIRWIARHAGDLGITADFDTPSHIAFAGGAYGLSTLRVRWFWDQYAADPAVRADPRAAPLHAVWKAHLSLRIGIVEPRQTPGRPAGAT